MIAAVDLLLAGLLARLNALRCRVGRALTVLRTILLRIAGMIVLVVALHDGEQVDRSLRGRVTALARDDLFDYVTWEIDALWGKAREEILGVGPYLDNATASALVLDYLDRLSAVQEIENQIEALYADPTISDPGTATADLRAERDNLRDALAEDQALAENVIEAQVSAVLLDAGFGLWGQVLPPVSMHMTEIPMLLIVSPRDRIAFALDLNLNPLPVDTRARLEATIDADLDVASLIVPLGGLSLYPSMIVEPRYRDLAWKTARAIEVTAHEWAHHYLMFYPLGWEYGLRPETRIINETTATFFGRAVAREVIARYYPDLPVPQYPSFFGDPAPVAPLETPTLTPTDPDAPQPFDYATAMHATRARVDFLLWQGMVEAAEMVMDAQQRKFARNGYAIRKLNQAYFAFYGGYQGSPGAGGTDPTGAAIESLLRDSADLEAFLRTLRDIVTREQLLDAVEIRKTE
ncbi:MAG: hypothetical protein K8S97_16085 [Anaerolineae bacterium]|nr:hypothetical protein [Anaerolineae bacterium]